MKIWRFLEVQSAPTGFSYIFAILFIKFINNFFLKVELYLASFNLSKQPSVLLCQSITFDQNTKILLSFYFQKSFRFRITFVCDTEI